MHECFSVSVPDMYIGTRFNKVDQEKVGNLVGRQESVSVPWKIILAKKREAHWTLNPKCSMHFSLSSVFNVVQKCKATAWARRSLFHSLHGLPPRSFPLLLLFFVRRSTGFGLSAIGFRSFVRCSKQKTYEDVVIMRKSLFRAVREGFELSVRQGNRQAATISKA